jgi:hypothetical protein
MHTKLPVTVNHSEHTIAMDLTKDRGSLAFQLADYARELIRLCQKLHWNGAQRNVNGHTVIVSNVS